PDRRDPACEPADDAAGMPAATLQVRRGSDGKRKPSRLPSPRAGRPPEGFERHWPRLRRGRQASEERFGATLERRHGVLEVILDDEPDRVFGCITVRNRGPDGIERIERAADTGDGLRKNLIGGVVTAGRTEIGRANHGVTAGTSGASYL